MKTIERKRIHKNQRRIRRRLRRAQERRSDQGRVFGRANVQYEISDRGKGIACGGIGAIARLVRRLGVAEAIDRRLHLRKLHLPYHESDHVLNLAYNICGGGACLDDIELRRQDEVFLDALGVDALPDPTTAGDFLRRFGPEHCLDLMHAIDDARLQAWQLQPEEFFDEAIVDVDGTYVPTAAECKEEVRLNDKGEWCYHPLVLTLVNTGEVLRLVNRPGNRPSHELADGPLDEVIDFLQQAGFRQLLLRGDTEFTQTHQLDAWSARGNVRFVFGVDAHPKLVGLAEDLPAATWQPLTRRVQRPPVPRAQQRAKQPRYKQQVIVEQGYHDLKTAREAIAEFDYQPTKCRRAYRVVVLRKEIEHAEYGERLFSDHRYFFYITNDTRRSAAEVVWESNDRCDQENLLGNLKSGMRALWAPVNTETANWAYMICASLAWNLKAWWALMLPTAGPHHARHVQEQRQVLRMEFPTFAQAFLQIPGQIIKTGRRVIYRILNWHPLQPIFYRFTRALRC